MAEPRTVTAYIDYKSPYAYLAKDLPYVLDIPSFLVRLGSMRTAELSRKSVTRISGGEFATAIWIAAARRENAVWRSAARGRSGTRLLQPAACSTPSARGIRCCAATMT